MKIRKLSTIGASLIAALVSQGVMADKEKNAKDLEWGKYLVAATGCNDCHTPGYPQAAGNLPESQWLTGSALGYQGPWGTTYPANLRLLANKLSESDWLEVSRSPRLPPMPWFNLRDMSDKDLIAMYRFIRSLGPAGEPAPKYAPPGQPVSTPYFDFTPKNMPNLVSINQ